MNYVAFLEAVDMAVAGQEKVSWGLRVEILEARPASSFSAHAFGSVSHSH